MITTTGNGPGPSGLLIVTGISSRAPLGAVVAMEWSETGECSGTGVRSATGPAAQPARTAASNPTTRPPRGSAMIPRFYATRACGREGASASLGRHDAHLDGRADRGADGLAWPGAG